MGFFSKLIKRTERNSVTPNSIHIGRKYRKWDVISLKVLTIVQPSPDTFQETINYSTTKYGNLLHRGLPKTFRKYGNYWYKFIYDLKYSCRREDFNRIHPRFRKRKKCKQFLYREISTDCIVADTSSGTDTRLSFSLSKYCIINCEYALYITLHTRTSDIYTLRTL